MYDEDLKYGHNSEDLDSSLDPRSLANSLVSNEFEAKPYESYNRHNSLDSDQDR